MKKNLLKLSALAPLGLTLALLGGCATNASVGKMVYRYQGTQPPKSAVLRHNIGVAAVAGGHETTPFWTSQISNSGFKQALEQSLHYSHLYTQLKQANFRLNVNLLKLEQPFLGLDLKVVAVVHYSLQDVKTKKTVFNKTITSKYTATFSDSPLAFIRLKIANEGAARMNIKALLADLYKVKV